MKFNLILYIVVIFWLAFFIRQINSERMMSRTAKFFVTVLFFILAAANYLLN